MKFLESKEIFEEQGNIKIWFKPIQPEDQAVIAGYQGAIAKSNKDMDEGMNIRAQMRTVFYALNSMVAKLEVKGKTIDHIKAAACSDITDQDTVDTLMSIYKMVVNLIVIGETRKKSSTQRKPTSKVSAAKGVQNQKKV